MKNIGLYIHIPYCITKCNYCSFNSLGSPVVPTEYISALLAEMEWAADLYSLNGADVGSIYFGGGTPSLLEARHVDILMNRLSHLFKVDSKAEVTIEINPATVDRMILKSYISSGINRASIGVQSFNNNYLKLLGRIHNSADARRVIDDVIKAGFDNISIDLIFAIENQLTQELLEDITEGISFNPKHISLYLLSIEEHTTLFEMVNKGDFIPADDISQEDLFYVASEFLEKNGFVRYETSNYAKKGYESIHNMKYWTGGTYLGFGAGAHSYLNDTGWGMRFWNQKNPELYINKIILSQLPVKDITLLTRDQAITETVFTSLRIKNGLRKDLVKKKFNMDIFEVISKESINCLPEGITVVDKEGIKITKEGVLIADEVVARILI